MCQKLRVRDVAVKANIHFDTFEQASWQIYKYVNVSSQIILYDNYYKFKTCRLDGKIDK